MIMTNSITITHRSVRLLVLLALALLAAFAFAGSAKANLEFDKVGVSLDQPPALNPDGSPQVNADGTFVDRTFTRQAGGHPDLTVFFKTKTDPDGYPLEAPHDIEFDLPKGFVGNPSAIPTCSPQDLS